MAEQIRHGPVRVNFCGESSRVLTRPVWDRYQRYLMPRLRTIPAAALRKPGAWQRYCGHSARMFTPSIKWPNGKRYLVSLKRIFSASRVQLQLSEQSAANGR